MRIRDYLVLPVLCWMLASCGGGGGGTNSPDNPSVVSPAKVGGAVVGLRGTGLVLQMGQGETLPIQATGTFTFPTPLAGGAHYDVKVLTQPKSPTQICGVSNGTGTLAGANITSVIVGCLNAPMSVGGTVSGLRVGGVVLLLKAGASGQPLQDLVTVTLQADGPFAFPLLTTDGMAYEASIISEPFVSTQSCVLANGAGTLDGVDVTALSVTCTTATFTVSGTVTGLHGQGLVLRNNGGDDLSIASDGSFTFSSRVEEGAAFDVQVAAQPTLISQTCFVANGSGTVHGDQSNVQVTCTATQRLGTSGDDEARGVVLGASGSLYVAGQTTGSFGGPNAGGSDGFLIKLNRNGELLWKRQFGSTGDESIHDMEIDAQGDLYLAGSTAGNLDGNTNAGSDDIFVTKYDGDGNKLWTRQLGSAALDVARGLRIAATGEIYLAGYTEGAFDGVTTPGGTDLFAAKLDANGSPLWLRQLGTPAFDAAYGIDVDAAGHAFIAGATLGDLDGHANVAGGEVGFILEYDSLGNLQDSALYCQLGCFNPSPAAGYRSHFNSIALVVAGGVQVAGWIMHDESGSFDNQYALQTTYESGGFTGRALYGAPTLIAPSHMVANALVPGRADGMVYMAGYGDVAAIPRRTRAFVKQLGAGIPSQRYEAVTESSGDAVGFAVTSDFLSNVWMVGYSTGAVDGHEGLGGRDIFISRFDINGEKQ